MPAHNEATTIAAVVKVLRDSGCFRNVFCVDDGSKDATSRQAMFSGAEVLRLTPNGGKAGAMIEGVRLADDLAKHLRLPLADGFAFFDSDLLTLTPDHVRSMHAHFVGDIAVLGTKLPAFDMVVGLQDHGNWNIAQALMPLVSGQRFVRRWVIEKMPQTCWEAGYAVEIALNYVVDRNGGTTCLVPLKGLTAKNKTAKTGFVQGWKNHLRMAIQIRDARKALERTGGVSCKVSR